MIAIIDYDAGNIRSVENALIALGEEVVITRDPEILLQAEKDDFVSVNALRKFAEKINHRGITSCEYVYLPGTRHETYRSDDRTMEMYLDKIMKFMDSCSGEMFSHYEVLRE